MVMPKSFVMVQENPKSSRSLFFYFFSLCYDDTHNTG